MAFREVSVVQVKELLRRWLRGDGERPIARGVGVDRKTARHYIAAALELGVDRQGGEEQFTDELIGQICEAVRPHRPDGHGESWRELLAEEQQIKGWVDDGLTVVKISILLRRKGIEVPHRTLARFAVERCGPAGAGRRCASTTRRRASNARSTSAASGLSPTARSAGCAGRSSSPPATAATSSSGRPSPRRPRR